MRKNLHPTSGYEETISHTGRRLTRQRKEVFDILLERRDHPTATEVFLRVQKKLPSISLATVYNCLETLVKCELVKQVNVDRSPTRYCPNLEDHGHFVCDSCGEVRDILPSGTVCNYEMPEGYAVKGTEITLRGRCPKCSSKN